MRLPLAIVLAVALAPGRAAAQDLWLEPGGEAGSAEAGPSLAEVADLWPAATTVVTGEELRRRGYRTVGQALEDLVGVTVVRTTMGPRYVMRGVEGGLLLVVDGVPELTIGERDLLDVDEGLAIDDVERIEVVRGPASALDGAGALAGVVRVTTRAAGLTGARVRAGATHLGQPEGAAAVAWRGGAAAVRASVSGRRGPEAPWRLQRVPTRYIRVGQAILPASFVDTDAELADDRATTARLGLEVGRLRVDASIADSVAHAPLSSFSHGLLDPDEQQARRRRRIRVRATLRGQAGPAALEAIAFVARHERDDTLRLYPAEGSFPRGGELGLSGDTLESGAIARALLPLGRHHRLVAGALLEAARLRGTTDATDPVDGTAHPDIVELDTEALVGSLAAEYQGDFGAGWHLTAGLAVEGRTGYGLAPAPRAAAVWFPRPELSFRLAYAEGTRTPDPWDLAALSQAVVEGGIVGAREPGDLAPERVRTGEAAAAWRPGERLSIELVGFVTRLRGTLATRVEGDRFVLVNERARWIEGGELVAAVEPIAGWLQLQLGVARAEELVVTGAAIGTLPGGLEVGARTRQLDLDAWASKRLGGRIDVTASVTNLLRARETNEDRAAFPGRTVDVAIPTPGTVVWATVEASF